jgi:hypothetical protein
MGVGGVVLLGIGFGIGADTAPPTTPKADVASMTTPKADEPLAERYDASRAAAFLDRVAGALDTGASVHQLPYQHALPGCSFAPGRG